MFAVATKTNVGKGGKFHKIMSLRCDIDEENLLKYGNKC